MKSDISIIIVNYNSRNLLLECLQSIKESLIVNYEVIIVDNNSSDDSFMKSKITIKDNRFIFVSLSENLGFAKANNIGVSKASGKVMHFLNPDTIVNESLNAGYDDVMKCIDNVYITPLVNMDGSIENSQNVIPTLSNLLKSLLHVNNVKYWYIGASVIISSKNFKKIGKLNENYFMYSEDLDLFYNIHEHNIKVFSLESEIKHLGGGCSQNVWNNIDRDIKKEKALFLFFKLNRTRIEYFGYKFLLFIHGMIFRPKKTIYLMKVFIRLFS